MFLSLKKVFTLIRGSVWILCRVCMSSPCPVVGSLWVVQLPPRVQRHACYTASTQWAIRSYGITLLLTAGCLDIPDSSCLGNPVIYLLPSHTSITSILRSHWQLLQSFASKMRKVYLLTPSSQVTGVFTNSCIKLLKVIDFLSSVATTLLWIPSCVDPALG